MKSTESVKFELQEWPENSLPDHDNTEDDGESDDFGSIAFCANEEEAKRRGHADALATLWPLKRSDIKRLCLNLYVRPLPQDNDTGGFFLGLIKKLK